MDVLLIDNNDSFTRNLEHLLVAALPGSVVEIAGFDRLGELQLADRDLIVISPGPGEPQEYPGYERVFAADRPILGVCLGMQLINEFFGGTTEQLPGCVHGKTDEVVMDGQTRTVARYHSLYAASLGDGLEVVAANDAGVPMCLRHHSRPIVGYQFHPESFLTCDGVWFIDYALDLLRTP